MPYLYIQSYESNSILDTISLFLTSSTDQTPPYNNHWKSKINWSIYYSNHANWRKVAFTIFSRIALDRMLSAFKDTVKILQVFRGNINFISYSVFKSYSTATLYAQTNAKWVIELPQLILLKLSLVMPERLIPSSPLLLVPIDTWK